MWPHLNFITSTKTLNANKIMFTGIMFRAWTYFLGGYQSTPAPSMTGDEVEISENISGLLVVWCFRPWLLCLWASTPPSLTLVCSTGPWSVSSVAQLCLTLCDPMDCSTPGLPAAAKSLQLCLTLCDPIDSSPPGSSIHGILQARVLEWAAIAFSKYHGYHVNRQEGSYWRDGKVLKQNCMSVPLRKVITITDLYTWNGWTLW